MTDEPADRIVAEHVANGATVHAGQWGQTVFQYADHYTVGSGLSYVTNQGQWHPVPTFSGDLPTFPGQEGACCYSDDGGREAVFANGRWWATCPIGVHSVGWESGDPHPR